MKFDEISPDAESYSAILPLTVEKRRSIHPCIMCKEKTTWFDWHHCVWLCSEECRKQYLEAHLEAFYVDQKEKNDIQIEC